MLSLILVIVLFDNLNKEEFTENDISSDYYYKTYGVKSIELKNKIIKGIKMKN